MAEYRKLTNQTLAQMASAVGVSQASMSRYEKGLRIPEIEIMRKIFVVTSGNVTPNDFYFDLPPQTPPY